MNRRAIIGLAGAAVCWSGCGREAARGPAVAAWATESPAGTLESRTCLECHQSVGEAWSRSHHALAGREVAPAADGPAFAGQTVATHAADYTFTTDAAGAPLLREQRRDGTTHEHQPSLVIAHDPLRQYVAEIAPGRWQAGEVAWDPHRAEWFAVFGDEERRPGEWGHWTGRGMNWNAMCARCHTTAYAKNYDATADTYASRWIEHGIGCAQCHGALPGHERGPAALAAADHIARDPARMMQTCAPCHARAESLTAGAPPGAAFDDHYRLQLVTEAAAFWPDGQARDEVFEYGSFRHSRMHAAGVTCMDCHEPHSGGLRLPADNNALCLQCHQPGGRLNAPPIDPTAHSFHAADSAGHRCVECHMPENTFMQRDRRRDHAFTVPDPVLSRELGLPNACNRCHADQSLDWSIAHFEAWYGTTAATAHRRARARAVAAAQRDGNADDAAVARLLELIAHETVPAWRASLLTLADETAPGRPDLVTAARELAGDADPLVRSAAVHALASADDPASRAAVESALADPVRLVRLEAAWARASELAPDAPVRRELDAWLDEGRDQPAGLFRVAQERFNRGERDEALALARRASAWDPFSAALQGDFGLMLAAQGRTAEAAGALERAARLDATSAERAFGAALAWHEAGNLARAEDLLGEALRRDRTLARAWYNLGLLQAQTARADEAVTSLREAERLDPRSADAPYALATVLLQQGRAGEAVAAAERALRVDPAHAGARAIAQQAGGR